MFVSRWVVARTRKRLLRATALLGFVFATMIAPRPAPAGTIAEQRARLPPPRQCEDSIVGQWQSNDFKRHRGMWEIFTLDIHRHPEDPNKLTGTITNHFWDGDENDAEPGKCPEDIHVVVSMDAEGTITGEDIRFFGVGQWRLDTQYCGSPFGYVLDVFEGQLDKELQEFQSVANDGIVAINERTVFRRIGCFDEEVEGREPKEPKVVVTPPSFYPPEEDAPAVGGCLSR